VLGIRFALSKRPRGTTLDSLDPREKRLVIYGKTKTLWRISGWSNWIRLDIARGCLAAGH